MKRALFLFFILLSASAVGIGESRLPLVAVSPDGTGMITELTVEVVPGSGRTFFSSEPLIGINTQNSERIATRVAERITNKTFDDKDVFFTIHTNATMVDGASAGAAMTIAIISAMKNETVRDDVLMTGSIHEDGSIGRVGSVGAKLKAAADAGATIFFIPRGHSIETRTVQVGEKARTVTVNLTRIGKDWGVDVIEVSNIEQVIPLFFGQAEEIEKEKIDVSLPVFSPLPFLDELGIHSLDRAEMNKEIANHSKESSEIAKELLEKAKGVAVVEHPYTVANNAFLASIYFCRSGDVPNTESELRRLENMIISANRTKRGDLEWLGSAQLRYLWAREREDECAKREWISAAEKMLDIMPEAEFWVDIESLAERAELYIERAEKDVASARAVGASSPEAVSSLLIAKTAMDDGYFEAAILSSIDAMAFSKAATAGGSNARLKALTEELSDFRADGFAEGYRRHSLYLLYRGIKEDSRQNLEDSVYLAYRARLYSDAFKGLPEKEMDYSGIINPALNVIGFALTISVIIVFISKMKRDESDEMKRARRKAREAAFAVLVDEVEEGRIDEDEYARLLRELK